ncbi:threonine/serine exporter family protein [Mycobacterium sp. 852013-50091_SCH5140682]|uniref:threonine/serine ThrE exporter family protein n=1 Tax=Mycobacterium sp. 852013-50091_SCH5140682 TaxID=1834109 RepID=UPI0009ECFECD|nr:threonine/serine exporter family protein [Mycobacterium sp. 852013-50091_SCH5140682]
MSETVEHVDDARRAVVDYLARLGAAMLAADYSVAFVRQVLTDCSGHYHVEPRFLILPNYIQVGESCHSHIEHVSGDLRYDQAFHLGALVRRTHRNAVSAEAGSAELTRILALPRPLPWWVNMIGYAVQSAAYGLILQPTPVALVAATGFGLLVGALDIIGRFNAGFLRLLPFISAFVVTFAAFSLGRWLHMGQDSLRVLIPPLTLFLPGVGITLAVLEASTGEVVSAAARLTQGFTRLAQLALGIVLGIQALGITQWELTDVPRNLLGPWAPWLGVAVYGVGIMLYHGPPRRFLPWLLLILYVSYAAQFGTAQLFGAYTSGFGGGMALMFCTLALGELRTTPSSRVLLAPGFWLMVPSSIGLVGITEIVGGDGDSTNAIILMLVSMVSISLGFQAGRALWELVPTRIRVRDDAEY